MIFTWRKICLLKAICLGLNTSDFEQKSDISRKTGEIRIKLVKLVNRNVPMSVSQF